MLRVSFRIGVVGLVSTLMVLMPVSMGFAETSEIPIQFSWKSKNKAVLTDQQAALNKQGAEVKKVQTQKSKKRNPMAIGWFIMAGAATVTMLADALIKVVKDLKQGGLIVDTRGEELKIIENPSLDRSQILMIQPDGQQVPFQYDQAEGTDLVGLLQTAVKGMKKAK